MQPRSLQATRVRSGSGCTATAKTKYTKLADYATCVAEHAMLGNGTPFATASTDVGVAIVHLPKGARI